MRELTEQEKLSWDANRVGEFGTNRDGSPRPSLEEVTKRRHQEEQMEADRQRELYWYFF